MDKNQPVNETVASGPENMDFLKGIFSQEETSPQKAMGMTNEMVEGIYGQAYRLYNTGKYQDAAQLFRLLVMVNPTDPKFTLGLAACLHLLKEFKNAIEIYTVCSILDQDSPIPLFHASDCYLQVQDKLAAMMALEMAVKRAGSKPEFQTLKDRASMTAKSLRKELETRGDLQSSVAKPDGIVR